MGALVVFCGISNAATLTSSTTTVEEPDPGKMIGVLDIRPTVAAKAGSWTTENYAEIGYQFSKDRTVSYVQFFNTNLADGSDTTEGVNLTFPGAFVRAKFNNIWKSQDESWSLGYQPRAYLPLTQADRDRGQIAVIRNYFTFSTKLSNSLSLSLIELPVVHLYNQAGYTNSDGEATANPMIENRVYVVAGITLSDKLSLSLPLYFHATLNRGFSGASNSGDVSFVLYTWPELTYTLTDNASLGFAFVTGNWVEPDLSGFTLGAAFEQTSAQVALTLFL